MENPGRDQTLKLEKYQRVSAMEIEEVSPEEISSSIPSEAQSKYRIWKKNAPFLYDYLSTHSLLWPSLTVLFFPDLEQSGKIQSQRILHGSFTLGQNIDSISIVQLSHVADLNSGLGMHKLDFNPDKEEFQWTGETPQAGLKVLQKINQLGDVNNVKYMPQNPNILGSVNSLGDIAIFERSKHSSFRKKIELNGINKPDIILKEHHKKDKAEIFALDWNSQLEGMLITGNMNGDVNIFDIKKDYKLGGSEVGNSDYYDNASGVNDIEWFPGHAHLFSLGDELGYVKMYDTRTKGEVKSINASTVGVNSLHVNPLNPLCLVSGDSQGVVKIWDLRSDLCFNTISSHTESITQVKWNPAIGAVFGVSSTDGTVGLYDAEKGQLFSHTGHMLGVNDFDWLMHDAWMVASVSDDNSIHIWKPASNIVSGY